MVCQTGLLGSVLVHTGISTSRKRRSTMKRIIVAPEIWMGIGVLSLKRVRLSCFAIRNNRRG